MTYRHPPMRPVAIREFIVGVLEDHEVDDCAAVEASRYADLADALTESWLKDRQRAITEAKGAPF